MKVIIDQSENLKRQKDRETHIQENREADRETERKTDRKTNRETERWTDRQTKTTNFESVNRGMT